MSVDTSFLISEERRDDGNGCPSSFFCAEHDRQFGGGSPLSRLMAAKDQGSAKARSRGLV